MEIVNGPQSLQEQNRWAAHKDTIQCVPTKKINDGYDKESEGGYPIKKSQFIVYFIVLNQFLDAEPIYWRGGQTSSMKYPIKPQRVHMVMIPLPLGFVGTYSGKPYIGGKRMSNISSTVGKGKKSDHENWKLKIPWWPLWELRRTRKPNHNLDRRNRPWPSGPGRTAFTQQSLSGTSCNSVGATHLACEECDNRGLRLLRGKSLNNLMFYVGRCGQKNSLFVKKLCVYSYIFKLQSPSNTLHLMQYTCWDIFSTAQNSFWAHQFWCLLVLLPFFDSPVPHRQNVSLWGLSSFRETKKK